VSARPTVAFLSNYPVPYQAEFLRALDAEGSLDVRPLFVADKDPGRSWPAERLDGRLQVIPSLRFTARDELRLPLDLRPALEADLAVIGGYSFLAFQGAMALRRLWRRPYLLWSETPRLDAGGLLSQAARGLLLRQVRAARGVLAIGARAQQVWRGVLGPGMPVVNFPYVCALDRYLALQRPPRPAGAPFTLLFCGQLVHRKGVDVLAAAFEKASREEPRLRLLLAGEGPEREALARALPAGRFELRGHVPWESLPALYAEADALVLPSRHDGWGLVVNEALASGIPVVATTAVGAATDLLREGETGFLVPPADAGALAAALLAVARAPAGMGERARALAQARLLPSLAARRFAGLVADALAGRPLEGEA
jgi:glycosyltransferase involved in cell wall biosynthesis